MPLISFFVDDLAGNSIVRAAPLAQSLAKAGYDVEVLGFLVSGNLVYQPYRQLLEYKCIRVHRRIRTEVLALSKMAQGEIIYACKPLPTTLLPALVASGFGTRKPLLLDVEDNEYWTSSEDCEHRAPTWFDTLRQLTTRRHLYALHPFTRLATRTTVVSQFLRNWYGGEIVLHGPDETAFNPEKSGLQKDYCRHKLGLPVGVPLALFAGVPWPHKGLETLIRALGDARLDGVGLIIAGPPEHPQFQRACEQLRNRVFPLGVIPNDRMPEVLAASDFVPTPQLRNAFTAAQIPAKLLEAMAMKKAVIGSRVSDIPAILGAVDEAPRGWVCEPGDARSLADCVADALTRPQEAAARAERARQWFLRNASHQAIQERLQPILEECLSRLPGRGR